MQLGSKLVNIVIVHQEIWIDFYNLHLIGFADLLGLFNNPFSDFLQLRIHVGHHITRSCKLKISYFSHYKKADL